MHQVRIVTFALFIGLAALPTEAGVLDDTAWTGSAVEKTKIKRVGRTSDEREGLEVRFDADGTWTVDHPVLGAIDGQWAPKGKRGMQALPSQSSLQALTERVGLLIGMESGAHAVEVLLITIDASGKVGRDGTLRHTLRVKAKAALHGPDVPATTKYVLKSKLRGGPAPSGD